MKRWLSFIKRHVTPGTWVTPAKKRRPLTMMTQTSVVQVTAPLAAAPLRPTNPDVDTFETAPLVPFRPTPANAYPLCDVDVIMERYAHWRSPSPTVCASIIHRPDSQVLPLSDIDIDAQAFVDHRFIHFAPTYTVTVSEVAPYQLVLRKPRYERLRKAVSFLREVPRGEVRSGSAIYFEE